MERDRLVKQGADDEMAAAHARDYARKRAIDTVRTVIRDFLDSAPNTHEGLRVALGGALGELDRESARLVRRWD